METDAIPIGGVEAIHLANISNICGGTKSNNELRRKCTAAQQLATAPFELKKKIISLANAKRRHMNQTHQRPNPDENGGTKKKVSERLLLAHASQATSG